jgi:hypothetical protein
MALFRSHADESLCHRSLIRSSFHKLDTYNRMRYNLVLGKGQFLSTVKEVGMPR